MMKNLSKVIVLMLTLTLLLCVSVSGLAANQYAASLPLLNTYAEKAIVSLINPDTGKEYITGEGEDSYVFSKNDPIMFKIDFEPTPSDFVYGENNTGVLHAIREAYLQQFHDDLHDENNNSSTLPSIDENTIFTIPFKKSDNMNLDNVPTSPNATGNIAYDKNNNPIFSWWLDPVSDQVCIKFTKEALEGTFEIESLYVGVQGTLDFDELGSNGRVTFDIAGTSTLLKLAVQYELDKDVKLVLNNATGEYEAHYTLTMDLNRNHHNNDQYPISILDVPGSAIGNPSNVKITSPDGSVSVITNTTDNGTEFILSSPSNTIAKGQYTITYTAPLSDEWTKDKVEDYSFNSSDASTRRNDATVHVNKEPTEFTANATVQYVNLADQVKVEKGIDNSTANGQVKLSGVYAETDSEGNTSYYVDYYLDAKLQIVADEFIFTDTASEWLEHIDEKPTVLYGKDGWWYVDEGSLVAADASVSYTDNGSVRTFTLTGDPLEAGVYRLKYRMKLTNAAIAKLLDGGESMTLSNTAKSVTVDGTAVVTQSTASTTIPASSNISKSGEDVIVITKDGKRTLLVQWTVTFQRNFFTGEGAGVVDSLIDGTMYVDSSYSFVIKNNGNNIVELTSIPTATTNGVTMDSDSFSYELGASGNANENTTQQYTITYYTVMDETSEGFVATTNKFGVDHDGDGEEDDGIEVEYGKEAEEARLYKDGLITKIDKANNKAIIEWTVTVDLQRVPYALIDRLEILDTLPQGMTLSSTVAPVVTLIPKSGNNVTLTKDTHYTVDTSSGLKIALNMNATHQASVTGRQVIVKFTAEGPLNNSGITTYKNNATVTFDYGPFKDQTASGEKELSYEKLNSTKSLQSDGSNNDAYNTNTGKYDWAGDGEKEYVYQIVLRDAAFKNRGNGGTKVKVIDTLPTYNVNGVDVPVFTVYSSSVHVSNDHWYNENNNPRLITPDSVSVSSTGFTAEFTVPGDWNSDTVYVYYASRLSDAYKTAVKGDVTFDPHNPSTAPQLINRATVEWDGSSENLSSSDYLKTYDKRLDKTAQIIDNNSQIQYSIPINSDALDLNSEGDALELTDAFTTNKDNVSYIQTSFKVRDASGNLLNRSTSVSDSTYVLRFAEDGKSFTLSIPDGKKLTLTYNAAPNVAVGEMTGNIGNKASLDGVVKENTVNSFEVSTSLQGATTQITQGDHMLKIHKKDSDDFYLAGATFTVSQITGKELREEVKYTTTSSGTDATFLKFTFKDNKEAYGKVYVLRESSAPEGYTASADAHYFYFTEIDDKGNQKDLGPAEKEIVAALEAKGITVEANKDVFEFTYVNEKSELISDSLDVTKIFYDRTIERTWGTGKDTQSFSFTLEADAATAALLTGYAIIDGEETITLDPATDYDAQRQWATKKSTNVFTIAFTAPGSYTFLVKETDENASNPAIFYDKTVYEVKYTVADDMTITRTFNVQGSDEKENFITFYNAINARDFSIPFYKDFKDFRFKDFDADDTFTAEFKLEKVDSTGKPIEGESCSTATASYTGSFEISFSFENIPFSYDDVGSYFYFKVSEIIPEGAFTVSEIIPEDTVADIVYDDVPVWVRAEVMMNGTTLIANPQYYKGRKMPESEEAWNSNDDEFTNIALGSITVHKAWNPQPETIPDLSSSLTLYARTSDGAGNVTDTLIDVAPVYDSEAGSYTWNNLPFTDASDREITYIVRETAVPDGYTVSYTPDSVGEGDETQPVEKDFAFDGETITNTLNTVDISGTKHWADGNADYRPIFSEVSLEVYVYNGTTETKLDPQPTVEWTSATSSNMDTDWTWTVKGLAPLPEGSEYRVREVFVGDSAENNESMFSASYENEKDYAVSGGTITNTLMTETIVTKKWVTNNNDAIEHPTAIFDLIGVTSDIARDKITEEHIVIALRNQAPTSIDKGESIAGVSTWTFHWKNLPALDANGNKITYHVFENMAFSKDFPYESSYDATFNEYTNTLWSDKFVPYAIKFLDGQQMANSEIPFTFVLTDVTDPANPVELERVQANRYGNVSFSVIEYGPDDLGKTYHYQMSEVLPSDATAENGYVSGGVKYDPTIYDVKIEIGEDGTVKKSYKTSTESDYVTDPEPSDDPNAEIEEYTIVFYNETLTSITVNKAWKPYLVNAPDVSGYLTLYARTTDSEGSVTDTAVKGVAPAYDSEAGTYTWNNLPKSDADGSKITYIVKEEGLPGYIASYSNGLDYAPNGKTITNTLVKADLPIKKELLMMGYDDVPNTLPEYAKSFTFTIKPVTIPEGETVKLTSDTTELTPGSDGSYTVTIDMSSADLNSYAFVNRLPLSFEFSDFGAYTFAMSEVIPSDASDHMVYDDAERTVTFYVTQNGVTAMGADLTYTEDSINSYSVTFTNMHYAPVNLELFKVWTDGVPEGFDPEDLQLQVCYAEKTIDDNGNIVYPSDLSSLTAYTKAEPSVAVDLDDPTRWIITCEGLPEHIGGKPVIWVIVETDVPDGYVAIYNQLFDDLNKRYALDGETIENVLNTVEGEFTLSKTLEFITQAENPEDAYAYSFSLTPDPEQADNAALNASAYTVSGMNPVMNDGALSHYETTLEVMDIGGEYEADRTVSFTFSEEGVYAFLLTEIVPDAENTPDGFIYDTREYAVTFTVTKENSGMLTASLTATNNGNLSFVNYYDETTAFAAKLWKGGMLESTADFEDYLTLEYASLNADNRVWQSYPHPVSYIIDEQPISDEDMSELKSLYGEDLLSPVWIVQVEHLPRFIGGEEVIYRIRETNLPGYAASYDEDMGYIINTLRRTSATLGGTKVLTGREFKAGDSFTFDLYEESTGTEPIDTVTVNPTSGNEIAFSFKELTYGAPGTYLYYIVERGGEIGGVTYDEMPRMVYVMVTEVTDELGRLTGALAAEVSYPDGVVFTNAYAAYGEFKIGGTKRFTDVNGDRPLEGQYFSVNRIERKMVDGEVVNEITDTVLVDEDGSFAFVARPFTHKDIGTYVYTINEATPVNADENGVHLGVTYDKTEYTFTLTVSDNGDGTLDLATEGYPEGGITFANTYDAEGSVTLYGSKFLENKDIAAGDFSFQLKDESGAVLQTVQNDKFGDFAFDKIQYGLDDLGEHVYTISEVIPEDAENGVLKGVTYDQTIKTVKVTVTDNGDGTLTAEITEDSDEIAFTNTYDAVGLVTFEGSKTMVGRDFTEGDTFTFVRTQITDEGETVLDSVTVTPNEGESVSFKFEDLTYTLEDAGKTFTYTVKEADTGIDGVIYATTIHEVSYTVVDMGDGKLGLQMLKGDIKALNFTNTYAAEGEVRFAGTKSLTGKALEADTFAFQLKDESGDVIQIVTNDAKGSFAFDAIEYALDDAGKTFTYTISEVIPEDAENGVLKGVTYDNTVHTVTVEVIDNGDGKLTAKASDNASAITFANTYAAEGEFQLSGSKTMSGRAFREGDEFTFDLVESGEVIDTVTVKPTTGCVSDFSFGMIALTLEDVGEKTYTVREVKGNISGVTYDTAEKQVTVVITDNGSGKLSTEITEESDDVLFTNTYEAGNSVAFSGSKTLNGKAADADAFSFVLKDAQGDVIEAVKNGADGTFAFSAINYTLADVDKTFTYTVSEVNDGKAGYTYDDTIYTVTVEVADLGTGALQLTVSANYESLDFANTYAATGSVSFSGSKALTGKALEENEFSFVLSDENGEIETVTNGADGIFAFSAIEYDLDDAGKTFTYTVSEVNDGKAGVTYDETVYTVTVDVTDNGDGTLKTVVSDNADALDFANAYAADGSVTFSGSKKMTGRSFIKGDEFTFELVENGEVIDTATIKPTTGSVSGFFFKPIAYTLDDLGEHVYTVREKNTGIAGVTYDETIYTVTVTVADAGEGKLSVEATENAKKLTFTNAYKAIGSAAFSGTKTLAGKALRADDFGFVLKDEAGEILQAVTNAADGSFSFDEIAYTEADAGKTFTYTISELAGSMAGVTYDKTVHTVTVEVTDNGDGTLTAKTSANAQALDFTNTYAADGSVVFSGTKTLTGKTLDAETFSFILTDAEGNEIETVTHDENGAFTFTKLTYGLEDAGKTFTYKVREIDSGMAGVTYDKNEYVITVEVIDNGDGTLAAKASANAQALDFTNVYTAKGAVSFSGSKMMVGRELEAGDFAFNLIDEDGVILETVVNEADGSFSFEEIAYTLEDAGKTFTYTVREENDEEPGVTYDDTVYTVTVKVTDNGDGTLKTETSENAAKLDFVNTYAADGSVVFTGTKILEGRELEAGEFSFVLSDADGNALQTATNDENGFFAFEPIKYDLADAGKTYTYTYKVAEKAGDAAGVTYDDTVHTVTVAVTDNGDGTLTVKPSSNANKLTFTNTYEAKGVVTFSGSKTMTGREFAEGDSFTFELVENGKVIDTAVITPTEGSSEAFSFKEITYTTADLGKHSYTVREAKGELGGVTYDETTYTIDVNVTDNGDGTLAMAVSPCYNALDFTNAYSAKGAYQIAGRKVYEGGELTGEDFTFVLRTQSGNVIEEIDNDETGAFAFSELAYDLDDAGKTFTYTVSEVNTAIRGVTYDETVYTVAVTVTDNGDGTLKTDAAVTAGEAAVSEIVFTNTFSASLTISKTVEGEETENTFPMTIRLYDAEGSELTGSYAYEGDLTGTMKSGDVIRLGHGQSVTISGLPVGTNYTVAEEANNAYETTVNGLGGSETDGEITAEGAAVEFVNERKLTSFSVTKRWEGGSGPIELTLYANGVKLDPQPVCTGHDDVYTFENLPMYTDDGEYITYYAKERYVDGYVTIYVNVDPHSGETSVIYDGGTIINRPAKQLSFKVKKVWTGLDEGEKTPEITLTLYCNGEKTNYKTPKPDKNGWYKYYDLPTTVNGKPAVYTVKEEPISGFQVFYQTADGETAEYANNGGQITNAKFPKTGDDSSLALWVALMGGCAALLALLLRRRKA